MEQKETRTMPATALSQAKKPSVKKGARKKKYKKLPLWAKSLIVAGLFFVSLIFGTMIGYSVIGNGSAGDIFSFSTWKHILDLIIG